RRSFREVKSPAHQLTFCQANFHLMGEDVPALIGEFGRQGKIGYYHFRDVRGRASSFVETFHDNGDHDMLEPLRCLQELGFSGPIRTDHAPAMHGEGEGSGYHMLGHIFALGYLRGMLHALPGGKQNTPQNSLQLSKRKAKRIPQRTNEGLLPKSTAIGGTVSWPSGGPTTRNDSDRRTHGGE
ncbi:MAG: mannonate dehydratase, partial [Opitutaceae bacterium]